MNYGLWKSVNNSGGPVCPTADIPNRPPQARSGKPFPADPALRACSACPGDYQDPDRTAWTAGPDDDGEEEEEAAAERSTEKRTNNSMHDSEFPVL